MKSNRQPVETISIRNDLSQRSMISKQNKSPKPKNKKVTQNVGSLQFQSQLHQSDRTVKQNEYQQARNISQPDSSKLSENLEQQKISQLNHNLSSLSVSVSNIRGQYTQLRQSQNKILSDLRKKIKKIGKLDHPKICEFLFKKQQEQQLRQQRRLEQVRKLEIKRKETQQIQTKQKQEVRQERIKQIKKSIFVNQKNMRKRQEQVYKQKRVDQIYNKYRNSIPLFQIKQKRSLQEQLKRGELVKQYLRSHKQAYRSIHEPFQQKPLQEHKKWYLELLQKLQKDKNQQRMQALNRIQEQNQNFRDLYRGKVTEQVMNQIKERSQKRKIPRRIRQNIAKYEEHVKLHHKPKPNTSRLKLINSDSVYLGLKSKRQNSSNLSFREVKRYKYLHGVSYGEIIEERPMAKSYQQNKRTGNSYLQFVKSLPKKRNQTALLEIGMPVTKQRQPNPLLHNRRKTPMVKLNSQPTRDEINMVLEQLRLNDKKIRQRQKIINYKSAHHSQTGTDRKQINEQILMNLQRKLNLLNKLQDNKIRLEQA